MTHRLRTCFAGTVFAAFACLPLAAGDSMVAFGVKGAGGLKIGGGDVKAVLPSIEYRMGFGSLMSLSLGAGYLSYTYTESEKMDLTSGYEYEEKGKGAVLSADLSFFPGRELYSGFYVGPGLSAMSLKMDYTNVTPSYTVGVPPHRTVGDNSGTGFEVHAKVGWAFKTGSVVIDPSLQLGYFLSMPKGGNTDAAIGLYALLGISVGFSF